MNIIRHFIRYALTSIGWEATVEAAGTILATDLRGRRFRIMVTPCE